MAPTFLSLEGNGPMGWEMVMPGHSARRSWPTGAGLISGIASTGEKPAPSGGG